MGHYNNIPLSLIHKTLEKENVMKQYGLRFIELKFYFIIVDLIMSTTSYDHVVEIQNNINDILKLTNGWHLNDFVIIVEVNINTIATKVVKSNHSR